MLRFSAFGFPVVLLPSFSLVVLVVLAFGIPAEQPWWAMLSAVIVIGISALWHELGHAFAARALSVPVGLIHIHGIGGGVLHAPCSAPRRLAIALSGPLAGFGLFGLAMGLYPWANNPYALHALSVAILLNGFWTALNLLPMVPLDGSIVLHAAVEMAAGQRVATQFVSVVGIGLGLALMVLALWLGSGVVAFLAGFFVYRNVGVLRGVL